MNELRYSGIAQRLAFNNQNRILWF